MTYRIISPNARAVTVAHRVLASRGYTIVVDEEDDSLFTSDDEIPPSIAGFQLIPLD